MKNILGLSLILIASLSWAGTKKSKPVAKSSDETTIVQTVSDVVTVKAGRPASADLKMKTSKVPAFEIYQKKIVKGKVEIFRVKSIPKLDIGEEALLASQKLPDLKLPATRNPANLSVTKLVSPAEFNTEALLGGEKNQSLEAGEAKVYFQKSAQSKVPVVKALAAAQPPVLTQPKEELKELQELPPVRLKLLQALIFLELQKSYNMALALFAELVKEKDVETEATYQLGLTSRALGLYSEYKFQMMKVLNDKDTEWQKKAAQSLAESAEPGDKDLVALLDPKIAELKMDIEKALPNADQYQLNRAKFYLDKNDLTQALAAVENVDAESTLNLDAQFLKSVLLYKAGQLAEAIEIQNMVVKSLSESGKNTELKSIAALTLARLYFQSGNYKQAFDLYLKVDKASPDFPQAMIEQAWSQILAEDYEGAAGNMFSLEAQYFKNTFAPESYVVRTVGYLNLCQYGDGAKVVGNFKRRYTAVQKQMEDYKNKTNDGLGYYETVKSFFKSREQKMIDGLPRQFVFELARDPKFVLEQKLINSTEDQVGRYNKITLDLIKKEREVQKDQIEVTASVNELKRKYVKASAEEKLQLKSDLDYQNKRLLSYKVQTFIAKKARNSIKELRSLGLARLDTEKAAYKAQANKVLKNRFEAYSKTLASTLDQADVLNYELYAGAGEHLRYQTAGGDLSNKERDELKPEDGKSLKWDFHGEVWQDELGHYRSGLKNVCPRESISQVDVKEIEK